MDRLVPGEQIRNRFPIFQNKGGERPLAYLDTAASSQKPDVVIDRLVRYYSCEHANIHRGAYRLSADATIEYEAARKAVAEFVNAPSVESIVFTRGATESVNLVSRGLEKLFHPGDVLLLTIVEHHSNIVPWQLLAARRGLSIEFVNAREDASLDFDDFRRKLNRFNPKLFAVTHVSNAFGSVMPIGELSDLAHQHGAKVLVDAAQSAAHMKIDLQSIAPDFLVFSGHKMYGPTGIGVLYANPEMLEYMDPFLGGGDMIETVTIEGSTWAAAPQKFEAGTPPIAEAVGLASAIRFIADIGLGRIAEYEHSLFGEAWELLKAEEGVVLYGPANSGKEQASIISFNVEGIHAHDLSTVADDFNVQFRSGHHCAMPAMKRFGLQSTARASFGVYSTIDDVKQLCQAIRFARKLFL